MASQVSAPRPQSGTFTIDFDDISTDSLGLTNHLYAAVPTRERDDVALSISASSVPSHLRDETPGTETSQTSHPHRDSTIHANLTQSVYQRWVSTPLDVLVSFVPLFFFIIASLCLSLNNKPVSPFGENLKAITLLSPTIFPIVYAAILGKMLRRIGLFKAERSATIGTLERFIGCQSLFATLERQFGLRHFDFLSISILLAWLLSPLGGQSSLRLLSTRPRLTIYNATVHYFPVDGFDNQIILNLDMAEGDWPQYAPLYMTALQTSRQTLNQSMDLFGNVKIPDVTRLKTFHSVSQANTTLYNNWGRDTSRPDDILTESEQRSAWYYINHDEPGTYTSLLGIPVIGIPTAGNTSFEVTSAYWDVRCDPFRYRKGRNVTDVQGLEPGPLGPSYAMATDRVDDMWNYLYQKLRIEVTLGSKIAHSEFVSSKCSATLQYIESYVRCEAAACAVDRVRELQRPVKDVSWKNNFFTLTKHMPGADMGFRQGMTTSSELVAQWIQDPDLKTFMLHNKRFEERQIWVNQSSMSVELFSHRLTMALNTFWDSTLGLQYRMGNLTLDDISNHGGRIDTLSWSATPVNGTRFDGDQYVCDTTFAIMTIIISWFLFMAANLSVTLGIVNKAPDILGYVSACARDNPYFKRHVPSHLDGLELARALQDVRVTIGDVRTKEDVGHIAFASTDVGLGRVKRKRLYD